MVQTGELIGSERLFVLLYRWNEAQKIILISEQNP